jgi:hypothetical protein
MAGKMAARGVRLRYQPRLQRHSKFMIMKCLHIFIKSDEFVPRPNTRGKEEGRMQNDEKMKHERILSFQFSVGRKRCRARPGERLPIANAQQFSAGRVKPPARRGCYSGIFQRGGRAWRLDSLAPARSALGGPVLRHIHFAAWAPSLPFSRPYGLRYRKSFSQLPKLLKSRRLNWGELGLIGPLFFIFSQIPRGSGKCRRKKVECRFSA